MLQTLINIGVTQMLNDIIKNIVSYKSSFYLASLQNGFNGLVE